MRYQQNFVPAGFESDEDDYDDFGNFIERKTYNAVPIVEDFERTLINACVTNNVPEIIRALNSGSININSYLSDSWTALMHAAFNGSIDVVSYLLDNGADPLLQYDCHNVIMCACNCTDISKEIDLLNCLKLFINIDGLDINSQDRTGMSALMYACYNGSLKIVEFLVNHGASIEMEDNQNRETALFFAVRCNHIDVVKFLLSRGANKDASDKRGQTIHRIAELKNMTEILKLLSIDYNDEQLEVYHSENYQYWNGVMAELENGFQKDLQKFLDTLSMDIYTDRLSSNNIIFKRLLAGNKNDFFKMGITLSPHRKLLETALKTFHLCNWSSRSLGVSKNELDAENIARVLATVVRQLHILDASLMYLGSQSHRLDPQKSQAAIKHLMTIKIAEENIFQVLDNQVRTKSVDYIKPHNLRKKNHNISIYETVFLVSAVILTIFRII